MDDRDTGTGDTQQSPGFRGQGDQAHAAYHELFNATAGAEEQVAARPRRTRRQKRRLLVAALVVLLLVVGGAVAAVAYVASARKQPALDALRAGNAAFDPVAAQVRRAGDLDGLKSAAEPAADAAAEVEKAAEELGSPSSALERGVRDVLRDEAAILRSLGGLTSLDIDTLGTWPEARDTLSDAEAALGEDVEQLARIEGDAARGIQTGRDLAAHSDELVGEFAGTSVTQLLDTQLDSLVAAKTTADLRKVAGSTARSAEVVALALSGVDAKGAQGLRIARTGEALAVLGQLRPITGEKLAVWPKVRTELLATTADLEGVDTRNAVNAVDGLVARATKALRDWRTAVSAATAKQQKDLQAVTTYVTAVNAAVKTKTTADQAATTFIARVREDAELTSAQAVSYLDGAAQVRAAVTSALQTAAPTEAPLKRLAEAHTGLVEAAQQAGDVVRSGYAGTKREKCGTVPPTTPDGKPTPAPCYYRDTTGWTSFSTGTPKALAAHTAAATTWSEQVAALRTAITSRKLPTKPVV